MEWFFRELEVFGMRGVICDHEGCVLTAISHKLLMFISPDLVEVAALIYALK